MLCIKCGNKIPDGSSFCNRCGTPLVAEPEVIPEPPVKMPEPPVVPEIPPVEFDETVIIQDAPVNQETVIVPQIPGDAFMEQPPLDQATIVVPEFPEVPLVSDDQSLEEMYPDQPEEDVDRKLGLIIGLIVAGVLLIGIIVVVILGMMNNWWRTESKDDKATKATTTQTTDATKPTEPEPPEVTLNAEQLRESLTKYAIEGLYLYLPEGFEEGEQTDGSITLESEDFDVRVSREAVAKNMDATTYAMNYETQQTGNYDDFERSNQYQTPYTMAYKGNRVTLTGFYVKDGYVWMVQIVTNDFENRKDELINYVTLAELDQSFAPVELKEFVFKGLSLTMDSSLVPTDNGDYCIYKNDKMMVVVQFTAMPSAGTSEEYAEAVLDDHMESGWSHVYMDSDDEKFYYVAMADNNGMVSLKGMYIYEGMGWIVDIDTEDGDKYAEAMRQYIISGRIIPDEAPKKDIQVEYNGLQLTLPGTFSETYRDGEYVRLSDGDLDVYIECPAPGVLPSDAEAMAQKEYTSLKALWNQAEQGSMKNAPYIACWNDTMSVVYGYYLVDNTCWVIRVEAVHTSRLTEMKTIAASGVAPEPTQKPDQVEEHNRINLTGQLTAQYDGLQVSYSPDWKPDAYEDPVRYYEGNQMVMMIDDYSLSELGVSNALELARINVQTFSEVWDNYELGIAGGVYYLLLWDNNENHYKVVGHYTDDTTAWEITIEAESMDSVEQGIWYATAGVIL